MNLREREPANLGDILNRYLRQKGYSRHSAEVLGALLWPEVVGPWYARHTEVTRVENGTLTVHCDSAPLAQQLVADSDKILSRLNRKVAEHLDPAFSPSSDAEPPSILREIRAGTAYQGRSGGRGRIADHVGSPCPVPGEIESFPLTAQEENHAQQLAARISDEHLRRRFLAALRTSLRLRHWQRAQGWQPCPTCDRFLPPDEPVCIFCNPPPAPPQVRD